MHGGGRVISMLIFPAIDLYGGEAVRLLRGDYDKKTVYSTDPLAVARDFAAAGAEWIHLVDLEGWTETTEHSALDFCLEAESMGVGTLICTDISRDGAMRGTNRELYRTLSEQTGMNIIASGGVSSMDDIRALRELGLYGAIVGRAYYTGDIKLGEAIDAAR